MKTTAIHGWSDVMHVGCPLGRTPTPTMLRGRGPALGALALGPMRTGDPR